MIKRNCSKQKGITLVALVVTIVVLLILAGITITYGHIWFMQSWGQA